MLAPTGSGKTLAAFLWCLDRLVRERRRPARAWSTCRRSRRSRTTSSATCARRSPASSALGAGGQITVDVRTGDTSAARARAPAQAPRPDPDHDARVAVPGARGPVARAASRRRHGHRRRDPRAGADQARHPPRADARAARAPGRRRSGHPEPQRIGLSATQRPLIEVARYLGGDRPVEIVDASAKPALDLEVVVPAPDMDHPTPAGADGAACQCPRWHREWPRGRLRGGHVAADLPAPARR